MALVGTEIIIYMSASGSTITLNQVSTGAIASLAGILPAPQVNTPVANVTGTTLLAAALIGGTITRSGPSAAFTDTLDTAANIVAAFGANAPFSSSLPVLIRNTTPFPETITGATGENIIPPNSLGIFRLTLVGSASFSLNGVAMVPITVASLLLATALNTVGAATITAAGIAAGFTVRGGAQTVAFTDTTDTAVAIIAAQANANVGQAWTWIYQNNSAWPATLAGGSGASFVAGSNTIVSANSWTKYLVTYSAAGTITFQSMASGPNVVLPWSQYVSISGSTWTAANIAGAQVCYLTSSGITALTTPTAAQIIAAVPNWQIGMQYMLRVANTNAGTLTLTASGSGVTLNGTATILTNTWREYQVTYTGAGAVTWQNVGAGDV